MLLRSVHWTNISFFFFHSLKPASTPSTFSAGHSTALPHPKSPNAYCRGGGGAIAHFEKLRPDLTYTYTYYIPTISCFRYCDTQQYATDRRPQNHQDERRPTERRREKTSSGETVHGGGRAFSGRGPGTAAAAAEPFVSDTKPVESRCSYAAAAAVIVEPRKEKLARSAGAVPSHLRGDHPTVSGRLSGQRRSAAGRFSAAETSRHGHRDGSGAKRDDAERVPRAGRVLRFRLVRSRRPPRWFRQRCSDKPPPPPTQQQLFSRRRSPAAAAGRRSAERRRRRVQQPENTRALGRARGESAARHA